MVIKYLTIVLTASVKFFVAFPLCLAFKLGFWETYILTLTGGILGISVFFWLSQWINRLFNTTNSTLKLNNANKSLPKIFILLRKKRSKRVFSRKNKFIIRSKRSYGLIGLAILTPVLLSIPLGTFLAVKYYQKNLFITYIWLLGAVFFWSTVLAVMYHFLFVTNN